MYLKSAVPVAVVVIGVGRELAPERVATKCSLTVMPTLSVQLPTATIAASVPAPNTRRPRIVYLLAVWGPHAQAGIGIPAPRALFKQSNVMELSGRRPEPAKGPAGAVPREGGTGAGRGSRCYLRPAGQRRGARTKPRVYITQRDRGG